MTGVAIVIPMLNEAAGLPRLLRSLAALEPPPAEVLAVDRGSADASVAIAEAAELLVVRHETRGRAAAINRGVQEATAPIICVLHADTLLPDDAVAVMRRVLADPGTALAGFPPAQRARPGPWGASFHNWIKTWYAPLLFRPQLFLRGVRLLFGDHAMFFRRADFLAVGGCDPTLLVMEEADLCIRFHRLGRTRLVNRVVITLRSPGRRLGRAAGELDLPQGRSTLGARLSQRAGAALPRRALNRSPAQIACGDAVVDQPSQKGLIVARTRASAQRPQIRVREPGVTLKVAGVERTSRAGRGSAPRGSAGPIRRFRAARSAASAGADSPAPGSAPRRLGTIFDKSKGVARPRQCAARRTTPQALSLAREGIKTPAKCAGTDGLQGSSSRWRSPGAPPWQSGRDRRRTRLISSKAILATLAECTDRRAGP